MENEMMELLDLYDARRNPLHKTRIRDVDTEEPGEYSLSVHVWIMNSKGEFLIQKRKNNLKRHPGKWGFTGGAVSAGETPLEGAKREVKEELSIEFDQSKIELLFSIKRRTDFMNVWLLKDDFDLSTLILQKEEVDEVMWASKRKIMELVETKQFVPSFNLYKDLFFKLVEEKNGSNP